MKEKKTPPPGMRGKIHARTSLQAKTSIRFKCFKGKSYAAFASIGKKVSIGVLSLCCSLLCIKTQPAMAQGKQSPRQALQDSSINLEGVEIRGMKNVPIKPMVKILAVLTQDELAQAGARDLQQLLRYVQSLDIRSRGGDNVQADPSIRGATFDQTLILLNGINFSDPQTGHHSLNLPVNFTDIERIEVLQGSGAWAYNAAPFSAAINIITRTQNKSEGIIRFTGGSYKYLQGEGNGTYVNNKWLVNGSASYTRSDGYAENTDFNILNTYVRARYADPEKTGIFNIQMGYQDKAFGANSFYSTKYPTQFEATKAFISSLNYVKQWKIFRVDASAYYRRHNDRFELFRDGVNAPPFYKGHSHHRTDLGGLQTTLATAWKGGTTSVGLNYRYEHIFSNALGTPLLNISEAEGNLVQGLYDKSDQRNNSSFFVQHLWENKYWKAGGGLMLNSNEDYGSKIFGGLSLAYKINPHLFIETFVNHAYRMPTFTDLYYNNANQIGNPNILPEQAVTSELAVNYRKRIIESRLGLFHRYGFQIIDWVRLPEHDVWYSRNLTELSTLGVEATFKITPNTPYIDFISVNYTYLNTSKNAGEYISLYATDYLRNQFTLSLRHQIYKSLGASWALMLKDRAGTYVDTKNTGVPLEKSYHPYILCDLNISWLQPQYEIFLMASNLFNVKYFDLGNLPQAGIQIRTGISIKF